jgi:ABC-type phosphate transport system ATPase subunit
MSNKISYFDSLNLLKSIEKMALDDTSNIRIKYKTNSYTDFEEIMNVLYSECVKVITPKYVIIEKIKDRTISSEYMSPGKKASIYLEMILDNLSKSDEPKIIIIDQPEDNLDNEFITDILIEKFRELRSKFQIIIVTHNASLALNSDSDNIIIAESIDGTISYVNGAIEDINYRKRICKLLDGGHYIFDKRYHKYDIPNRKIFEPISKEEIKL